MGPKPTNNTYRNIRKIGMTAKFLACVHITQMHFHKGNSDTQERIAQRYACMRERGGVNNNAIKVLERSMHMLYERRFCITLVMHLFDTQVRRSLLKIFNNRLQSL